MKEKKKANYVFEFNTHCRGCNTKNNAKTNREGTASIEKINKTMRKNIFLMVQYFFIRKQSNVQCATKFKKGF